MLWIARNYESAGLSSSFSSAPAYAIDRTTTRRTAGKVGTCVVLESNESQSTRGRLKRMRLAAAWQSRWASRSLRFERGTHRLAAHQRGKAIVGAASLNQTAEQQRITNVGPDPSCNSSC